MLGERYHEIHPPQQRPLQREKQRKSIAGMRLGVVHDHRHGNADATQRHDHQQVERAWHRTHGDPGGQAAQTPAELHDGDRGSHEPPGQAEQACIGLYWKVATRRVRTTQDLRGARQRQYGRYAAERFESLGQQSREAWAGAISPPLPDDDSHVRVLALALRARSPPPVSTC